MMDSRVDSAFDWTGRTIFVLDDDAAFLGAIKHTLSLFPCVVHTFDTLQGMLEAGQSVTPDCVLLDYLLPEPNGLEVRRQLVRSGWVAPVIIITGQANVQMTIEAYEEGVFAVLEKPFSLGKMQDTISRAFKFLDKFGQTQHDHFRARQRLMALDTRELAVLSLLAEGVSAKQMAIDLNVSLRTIQDRRRRIRQKTKSNTVDEAVALFVQSTHAVGIYELRRRDMTCES